MIIYHYLNKSSRCKTKKVKNIELFIDILI
uniref:Uncharacterized protein n=1 Tax=Siphoviridae sp. ctGDt6 TaxID=2825408 RepID=A0A8S5U810_9CAUD|nr:MAG TPA: hypothetical protein [Siphoviridae sp. ctGDt6]DAJ51647.1 MAG TPA: hypothetical protein [Bacteriophage sp.]DAK72563.1 MAG TPA: hypothetical protein [Caudoviricetes sp.]DAK01995.1 MAG TPA: hypothetical protein [Bacteriophage sp.]DAK34544.1 MAG TPA: hypothetical protein [Bacteriophage sp.]